MDPTSQIRTDIVSSFDTFKEEVNKYIDQRNAIYREVVDLESELKKYKERVSTCCFRSFGYLCCPIIYPIIKCFALVEECCCEACWVLNISNHMHDRFYGKSPLESKMFRLTNALTDSLSDANDPKKSQREWTSFKNRTEHFKKFQDPAYMELAYSVWESCYPFYHSEDNIDFSFKLSPCFVCTVPIIQDQVDDILDVREKTKAVQEFFLNKTSLVPDIINIVTSYLHYIDPLEYFIGASGLNRENGFEHCQDLKLIRRNDVLLFQVDKVNKSVILRYEDKAGQATQEIERKEAEESKEVVFHVK